MENVKKILICDNNQGVTDTLETILSELTSVEVLQEPSSRKAYNLLLEEHPDLLILNLDTTAFYRDSLISIIRADENFRDLYILCISAYREVEKLSLFAGADAFLAKPLDLDDLLACVAVAIDK